MVREFVKIFMREDKLNLCFYTFFVEQADRGRDSKAVSEHLTLTNAAGSRTCDLNGVLSGKERNVIRWGVINYSHAPHNEVSVNDGYHI
jgi:hypothetical protein